MKNPLILAGISLFTVLSLSTSAQKLPSVQKNSLRAPEKIKVDGKSAEWQSFQAFNTSTNISYTLANDDENLYLAVQSVNPGINSKILIGGLTLTINTSESKKSKDAVSVMFPAVNDKSKRGSIQAVMASLNSSKTVENTDPAVRKRQMDSVSYVHNRKQIDKIKEIQVTGIKEIQDTILSIYNDQHITARALFEDQSKLTYELSLPLKYLNLSTASPKEFTYKITLNGVLAGFGEQGPMIMRMGEEGRPAMTGPGGLDVRVLAAPTDFSGKYTLAKK